MKRSCDFPPRVPTRTQNPTPATTTTWRRCTARQRSSVYSLISSACTTAARPLPALSIASASRSSATTFSGRCFLRRPFVADKSPCPQGGSPSYRLHQNFQRRPGAGQLPIGPESLCNNPLVEFNWPLLGDQASPPCWCNSPDAIIFLTEKLKATVVEIPRVRLDENKKTLLP